MPSTSLTEYEQLLANQSRAYLTHIVRLTKSESLWRGIVEKEEALIENLRAIDYSQEHVSGTSRSLDIADRLDKLEQNRTHHEASLVDLADAVSDAHDRITKLEPVSGAIISLRYLHDLSWRDVSETIHHDYDYTRTHLHDAALLEMYEHLPIDWKIPEQRAI